MDSLSVRLSCRALCTLDERNFRHANCECLLLTLYTPLEDWQIRILTLQPGEQSEPLVGELYVVDVLYDSGVLVHGTKQRLTYSALSYRWRDSWPCQPFTCNGQGLHTVRYNDYDSRRIRYILGSMRYASISISHLGSRLALERRRPHRAWNGSTPTGLCAILVRLLCQRLKLARLPV
jgi:hypothetical protein